MSTMQALEREHEALYATLILPVTHYVMEALPEDQRETTKVSTPAHRQHQKHRLSEAIRQGNNRGRKAGAA
jgi:hypothetical protein